MLFPMQNPLTLLRQAMVRLAQRRHWLSPTKHASPEELRQMMQQMLQQALANPETALLLRRALTGPVLPFVAGTPNTDYIMKDDGSGNPIDTVTPIFEDATNQRIGIGIATPVTALDVAGTIRAVLSAGAPSSETGSLTVEHFVAWIDSKGVMHGLSLSS